MASMEQIRTARRFKVEMLMSLFEIPDAVTQDVTMYAGGFKVAIWPSKAVPGSVYITVCSEDNEIDSIGYRCKNNKDDIEKHLRKMLE
ncbi:MAG TPA: hypothetical protein VK190_02735 [Pseudoneobacillus sp.]|nr:hypothetical protein [Pseudoneobacillus sp.]